MGAFNIIGWMVVILTGVTSFGGQSGEQNGASLHREHQKEIAIWFTPDRTEVCLHTGGTAGLATAHFELLNNSDHVIAAADTSAQLSGSTHLKAVLPLAISSLPESQVELLKWYRLRYGLTINGQTRTRTVTVIDAIPNQFVLQVTAPERCEPGMLYQVAAHARAIDDTGQLPGVAIHAYLTSDKGQRSGIAEGVSSAGVEALTNQNGLANFAFKINSDVPQFAQLTLLAFKDGAFETQALPVRIVRNPEITISTDKPLYQPGQTIHSRFLVLGRDSNLAQPDAEIKLTLHDERSEIVGVATERADRFGVASHDFELLGEAAPGQYRIDAEMTNPPARQALTVEVKQYELPTFTVVATPSKKFYLRGDAALISIRAEYIFGKAVASGHLIVTEVNVVSHQPRRRKNRKTEAVSSGKKYEAELNDGHAEIKIEGLKAEAPNAYFHYADTVYSAFVTDASTGRTEQTKFKVRVSREAIHVYIHDNVSDLEMPVQFYVTTDYPDGSPAECEIDVEMEGGRYRRSLQTNRLGLAKVITDYIADNKGKLFTQSVSIKVQARDSQGMAGIGKSTFMLTRRTLAQIKTDHSLYRAGESVRITITAPPEDKLVRLEVSKES